MLGRRPSCPTAGAAAQAHTTPYAKYHMVHGNPAWARGGFASAKTPLACPANPGAEDDELLDKTLTLLYRVLDPISSSVFSFDRLGDPQVVNGWWISQAVGNDPDSAGYYFADLKIPVRDPNTGKMKEFLVGAAFDIVLTDVPVFDRHGRRTRFGPYVKALRDQGFVAWHRWAGEDRDRNGHLASIENEMHCIDPAVYWPKPALEGQIDAFRRRESGGWDYDIEPEERFLHLAASD